MTRRLVFGLPKHLVLVIDRAPRPTLRQRLARLFARLTHDKVVMGAALVFLAAMFIWRCAL